MSGEVTKDQVVAWLEGRARAWFADADKLVTDPDPVIRSLVPQYRGFGSVLEREAVRFRVHGPLPPLDRAWYANEPARSWAECPDWPAGCGEIARKPVDEAPVVRHREGCAFVAGGVPGGQPA